jgi:cytochrome c oxidase subunit 2
MPIFASILSGDGSESSHIAKIWWITFGMAAFVYVVVAGLIVYALTRGRRRGAHTSRLHETGFIWIGGVAVPAVILAVIAVMTVASTADLRTPQRGELQVDVQGNDWWWGVRYPASGVATANEIHLPVDRPVDIRLTSRDVVHSFWVPELAGKEDVVPGQPNHLRFTPEHVGTYVGHCAEFCGIQHAHMGFLVVVQSPADFGRWLARRTTTRVEPVSDEALAGASLFQSLACAGCHTIRGTEATGKVGPDLSDVGSRLEIGAGAMRNTPENLAKWIYDAQAVKPGVIMPPFHTLSARERQEIATYLESLK